MYYYWKRICLSGTSSKRCTERDMGRKADPLGIFANYLNGLPSKQKLPKDINEKNRLPNLGQKTNFVLINQIFSQILDSTNITNRRCF